MIFFLSYDYTTASSTLTLLNTLLHTPTNSAISIEVLADHPILIERSTNLLCYTSNRTICLEC